MVPFKGTVHRTRSSRCGGVLKIPFFLSRAAVVLFTHTASCTFPEVSFSLSGLMGCVMITLFEITAKTPPPSAEGLQHRYDPCCLVRFEKNLRTRNQPGTLYDEREELYLGRFYCFLPTFGILILNVHSDGFVVFCISHSAYSASQVRYHLPSFK